MSYEKVFGVLEEVNAKQAKHIRNSIWRFGWRFMHDGEKKEDYFVRIIMDAEYRKAEFIGSCRYFGVGSVKILDEVRSIIMEQGE